MPFTIAHTVAARPIARLSGGRLLVPALAVGAMAPDFEYLVHLSATRTIGHTLAGVFVLCLPSSLVVLLAWYGFVGRVLAQLLERGTGGLTRGWGEANPFASPARFGVTCISVVVGALSHIAWDAFTHDGGAGTALWWGFSHRVGPLPVHKWLQYGGGVWGMTLLGVWAYRAASAPQVRGDATQGLGHPLRGEPRRPPDLTRTRLAVAGVVTVSLLLAAAVGATRGAAQGGAYGLVRGAVIGALAGGVVSVFGCCVALARRLGLLSS